MEDEEYEILPHERVEHLRKEVEKLKSNPFIESNSSEKLLSSIDKLTKSINRLEDLFQSINNVLLDEYRKGDGPDQKLDKILDQNKQIAEALVNSGQSKDESESYSDSESFMQENKSQKSQSQQPMYQQVPQQMMNQDQNQQRQPKIFQFPDTNQAPSMYNMSPGQNFGQMRPETQNNSSQGLDDFDLPSPPNFGEPNYPTPDNFPEMKNPPPLMGEPKEITPKKKKFLGLI
ncbi:hypothetical protein COV13_03490 [Candidatus Woesearchaeota archaeon CG10_big_fil_rev_8_21_14_0_10_32_9]|nr:MAG: hypothetical protein COV13_03490 [Candidatus Woesearchaeota archaeon CG10_big_fil_rev_8_21_14_0_10_32_9]